MTGTKPKSEPKQRRKSSDSQKRRSRAEPRKPSGRHHPRQWPMSIPKTSQPSRCLPIPSRAVSREAGSPVNPGLVLATTDKSSQVVLKIRRRKFQQQFRAGEIVVTRRLFRSGDSEYLLNGKLCRLRDIQELFMGTGLGPNLTPSLNRDVLDRFSAAVRRIAAPLLKKLRGSPGFKTKKRLAEARLEDAKQNLSRINDIFDEVTRQMNSLKRQASKAERYAKLREEMRAKLRLVLASKFAQLDRESIEVDERINLLSEEMRHRTSQFSNWKANTVSAPSAATPSKPRSAKTANASIRSNCRANAPTPNAATTKNAARNCWCVPPLRKRS